MPKNSFQIVMSLAMCGFVAGCASKGFDRVEMKEQVGIVKPVFDDKEIKEAFYKKGNLTKPFRLGVFFKPPKDSHGQPQWRWTEQDKLLLEEISNELKSEGIVSDVFPLVSAIIIDEDLRSLRLIAAKHQADALLIVGGGALVDRYINNWGWSYILLLPTLFVPGSKVDTLFLTNASLWDVKNEYLYLTAESESVVSENYVAAFGKTDKELIAMAKTQALTKLKDELKKMIIGTKL